MGEAITTAMDLQTYVPIYLCSPASFPLSCPPHHAPYILLPSCFQGSSTGGTDCPILVTVTASSSMSVISTSSRTRLKLSL